MWSRAYPPHSMFLLSKATGTSLPTWLSKPGPVLVRKFNHNQSMIDPIIEYAIVKYPDGRESPVSCVILRENLNEFSKWS